MRSYIFYFSTQRPKPILVNDSFLIYTFIIFLYLINFSMNLHLPLPQPLYLLLVEVALLYKRRYKSTVSVFVGDYFQPWINTFILVSICTSWVESKQTTVCVFSLSWGAVSRSVTCWGHCVCNSLWLIHSSLLFPLVFSWDLSTVTKALTYSSRAVIFQ